MDEAADPDAAEPLDPQEEPSTSYSGGSAGSQQQREGLVRRPKSALRRYVESFDQETMMETARCVAAAAGGCAGRG